MRVEPETAESVDLVPVATLDELAMAELPLVADVDGRELCLVMCGEDVYAFENRCTHREYPLNDSAVDRISCEIECDWHLGRYDVRTGAATKAPCREALRTYRTVVRGWVVFVEIS